MTANLSLADRPFSEYSTSYRPSNINLNRDFRNQVLDETPSMLSFPIPPGPTNLTPQTSSLNIIAANDQPSLISVAMDHSNESIARPGNSGLSDGPYHARQDSIANTRTDDTKLALVFDRGNGSLISPQAEATHLVEHNPGAVPLAVLSQDTTSSSCTTSQTPYQIDSPAPQLPRPRCPFRAMADIDIPKLKEQRNETYQIKHFNWFDHSSRTLRRSSMLTQNKNGPCPLLALVNALILGVDSDSRSALGVALRTREQVSLGLIIESLMDELTSEGGGGHLTELPDVDELNRFLLMLHTGMTANPRLAPPTTLPNLMDARNSSLHLPLSLNNDRQPGTFEETQDMRLYGAFGIPLVHGWLAPRSDPARAAFTRCAPTYEDAQTIRFREEELEDRLSSQGLTSEEQQLLQDISSIKSFLASYPTQITSYGLDVIRESLFPGAVGILFRNDHFCTIYKHPDSAQLFTLVTDAGYSDRDEVIWESLVDVNGQNSDFFSGDFRAVGNADAPDQAHRSHDNLSSIANPLQPPNQSAALSLPTSFQDQQQQADADFALALQLQEEEEARVDDNRQFSGVGASLPTRSTNTSNSRRVWDQESSRPTIPPRNARNQGVNRPTDLNSDEAPPPAYEEAAKGRPYLPPVGHPHHSSFDGRSPASGTSSPIHPPGPRAGVALPRRTSAFEENSQFHNTAPLSRPRTNNSIGVTQSSNRPRDREKDCIIM